MAVYTHIDQIELIEFLEQYDIGSLVRFESILEGIENSNYKLITTKNKFILTIFEKRTKPEYLPFFVHLKNHLIKKNFHCPKPIINKKGISINNIKGKKCLIISYIEGNKLTGVTSNHCKQVGEAIAKLHQLTSDFKEYRSNSMDFDNLKYIFRV